MSDNNDAIHTESAVLLGGLWLTQWCHNVFPWWPASLISGGVIVTQSDAPHKFTWSPQSANDQRKVSDKIVFCTFWSLMWSVRLPVVLKAVFLFCTVRLQNSSLHDASSTQKSELFFNFENCSAVPPPHKKGEDRCKALTEWMLSIHFGVGHFQL